jgi:hypothetical protein
MKGLRRGLVACVVACALVALGATAQPVEAGAVPGWRTVVARVKAMAERWTWLFSGAQATAPEHEGGEEPLPPEEQEVGTAPLFRTSGQNEVLPSFDPDG